jgi:hypothetical protein
VHRGERTTVDTGDDVGDRILGELAAGRYADVRALLGTLDPDDPLVAVARADLRVRRLQGPVTDLQDLRSRLVGHGPGAHELVWWVDALIAERLIGELDHTGAELAATALAGLPGDELAPRVVLYARARLRRAASALWLFRYAEGGADTGRRMRDEAVVDFLRGGFTEEVVMTRVLAAAGEALLLGHDVTGNLARLADGRALLIDERSRWPVLIDELLVLVAAKAGQRELLDAAQRRLAAAGAGAGAGRTPSPLAPVIEGVLATTTRPDPRTIGAVAAAVERIDPSHMRWRWCLQLEVAAWLGEAGLAESVRFLSVALDTPGVSPLHESWREVQRWRLEARHGPEPGADEMLSVLDAWAAVGWDGLARQLAALLATELDALHAPTAAAHLRAWPHGHAPADARWPAPTVVHLGPAPATSERPDTPAVTVNVLGPMLDVTVDGRAERLTEATARLLAYLVIAAPGPRHVEQLGELLWPDVSPPLARQRLNGLVHRLRRRHPAVGSVLEREGETIELDLDRCRVDLIEHRARCRRGAAERIEALASIGANLCEVQFAYDEHVLEARHAFAADWLAGAATVIDEDGARARLAPAAAALGVGEVLERLGEVRAS